MNDKELLAHISALADEEQREALFDIKFLKFAGDDPSEACGTVTSKVGIDGNDLASGSLASILP